MSNGGFTLSGSFTSVFQPYSVDNSLGGAS